MKFGLPELRIGASLNPISESTLPVRKIRTSSGLLSMISTTRHHFNTSLASKAVLTGTHHDVLVPANEERSILKHYVIKRNHCTPGPLDLMTLHDHNPGEHLCLE